MVMRVAPRSRTWQHPGRRLAAAALALAVPAIARAQEPRPGDPGLTAVAGLTVGQVSLDERPTGCTVILSREGAVAGVDVRGGAPGTRETDLLDPANTAVSRVHGVVLAGGSAFGLDAASGVVRYLEEQGAGFPVGELRVPIVVGAILFDLGVGDASIRPGPECGYRAASLASAAPVAEGNVGAGTGATVGKLRGLTRAMKGGVGSASVALPDGLTVGAIVAVNALGDVVDPATGRVVAGVRTPDGRELADARVLIREGTGEQEPPQHTVIGVVATNAALTPAEATRMARMAQDGLARAVYPVHTPYDGDTVFALATGRHPGAADVTVIGSLAADVMARAIVQAVLAAEGLPGLPAARDLGASR